MDNLHKLRKPLTKEGHSKLADEHAHLSKVERPKVIDGITTAAAEGDRSENAEYIYGKKRLRELDKRIRYLNSLLKDAQIIDPNFVNKSKVSFATKVHIRDENGKEKIWMIVGVGEADYDEGKISWKSPVAKALFGKQVGDIVTVNRPSGEIDLEIIQIS